VTTSVAIAATVEAAIVLPKSVRLFSPIRCLRDGSLWSIWKKTSLD